MPFIDLETNLPASKFSEDFLKKLCTTTASALGKPEDVSIVILSPCIINLCYAFCFNDSTSLWPKSYDITVNNTYWFIDSFIIRYKLFSVLFGSLLLQRMNLVVKADLPMLIAGSCSPCVMLCVSAIGVTDTADKNKEHSAKIFQFLTEELELSEDR